MKSLPLTLTALFGLTPPAFSQFNFELPLDTGIGLHLLGNPAAGGNDAGIVGFHRFVDGQADSGHAVQNVVLNAPTTGFPSPYNYRADYYIAALGNGPNAANPNHPAAKATGQSGLTQLDAFMTINALVYSDIAFFFGPKAGEDLTETWNLGADIISQDWYGDLTSSVEERIYQANPDNVVVGLAYQGMPIIEFGYSALYEILDYGPTAENDDDTIQAFSDPVAATAVDALAGDALGLATAFLADVNANGGLVQLRFDTFQPISYLVHDSFEFTSSQYLFSGSIQVVSAVPEPSHYALMLGLVSGGFLWVRRRRRS